MQTDKFLRVWKIIGVLSSTVRIEVREEMISALLEHSLTMTDKKLNYVFVCLRNKKMDLLRGKLSKHPLTDTEELTEENDETEYLDEALSNIPDLGWIYEAFFTLTPVQQDYLREIIRVVKSGRNCTVGALCKKFDNSRARTYLILSQIKEKLSDRETENQVEIATVGELYDRLRKRRKH